MFFETLKKIKFILQFSEEKKLFYLTFLILSAIFILEFISIGTLPIFINIIIKNKIDFNLGFIDLQIISSYIRNNLLSSCLLLVLLYFIKNIFMLLAVYTENIFTFKVVVNLSKKLYEHYTDKNLLFFKKSNSSDLYRNFSELKRIGALLRTLQLFMREFLIIVSMLTLLTLINWKVTLLTSFILISTTYVFFMFYRKISYKIGKEFQENDGKRIKSFYQGVDSVKESRIYGLTNSLKKIFYISLQKVEFIIVKTNIIATLPRVFFEIIAIIFFGLLVFLSFEVFEMDKNRSIYFITIFATVLIRLLPSFQQLSSNFSYINFFIPALDLIYKELNDKTLMHKSLLKMSGNTYSKFQNLKISNLYFDYDDGEKLLSNINLEISKNEKIGIYGESGSGKSTLIEIIAGLITPSSGKIFINNLDIYSSDIKLNIGYIPQSVYLYDTTIKQNINLDFLNNLKTSDDEKIKKTISESQLTTLINKNLSGVNSKVGQLGKMISGGQIQRIGIARALYKDSDLLILDEFTSSLDIDNEKKVMDIVNSFTDKTIILVSHKSNLFKNFDKVYELKDHELILRNKNG